MIHSERKGVLSVTLSNNQHTIVADVNKTTGGEDEGLNPHELVEAALASCTSMTIELYAKRKNWDVSQLKVEVQIMNEGTETLLDRKISFGDIPSEQKTKLIEIANKCPIHKLLVSNIKIETYEK